MPGHPFILSPRPSYSLAVQHLYLKLRRRRTSAVCLWRFLVNGQGSQSSVDLSHVDVVLVNTTHPISTIGPQQNSHSCPCRGHGHRRRASHACVHRGLHALMAISDSPSESIAEQCFVTGLRSTTIQSLTTAGHLWMCSADGDPIPGLHRVASASDGFSSKAEGSRSSIGVTTPSHALPNLISTFAISSRSYQQGHMPISIVPSPHLSSNKSLSDVNSNPMSAAPSLEAFYTLRLSGLKVASLQA
ncbi:hypothetical protein FPV67DRAFT_1196237 [Lyophyllum atratum]|nr:hypothetical protein FPV67DRAFT_1196237 [Lyophyllum atratum]